MQWTFNEYSNITHSVQRQVRLRLYEDGKAQLEESTAGAGYQMCVSLLPQYSDLRQFMRYAVYPCCHFLKCGMSLMKSTEHGRVAVV